jgi:hypothetical protein
MWFLVFYSYCLVLAGVSYVCTLTVEQELIDSSMREVERLKREIDGLKSVGIERMRPKPL